jgi:hypothetical protein
MHLPQPYSSPQAKSLRGSVLAGACVTPASAFTREQRMLARYYQLLYALPTDAEVLMNTIWGPGLSRKQMYGDAATDGKIDRLDYAVPDLIKILLPKEQLPVEELLNAGDLVGTIRYLLTQERALTTREFPSKAPNDEGHARTAGLGYLSSVNYGRQHSNQHPHSTVAALLDQTTADSTLLAANTATAPRPTPPQQLRPKHRPLQAQPKASTQVQVKKAQERKRLRRKRR